MSRIFRLYIDESGDHSYGKKELQRLRIKFKDSTIDVPMDHNPELEKEEKRRRKGGEKVSWANWLYH